MWLFDDLTVSVAPLYMLRISPPTGLQLIDKTMTTAWYDVSTDRIIVIHKMPSNWRRVT
jgi:hypothetical protein